MTVAITGGTGFVGQAVLDAAARQGVAIRALTRRPPDAARANVEWVKGDLSDTSSLAALARGADTLIHIAGLTNTPDPAQFATANVEGTANVLQEAREAGVRRFVFVSSLSAREPQLSLYGASKALAEPLVEASGLDWTIVRPSAVYGPRDVDIYDLFRAAKYNIVPLPPHGYTSLIHVDDLAELLLALVPGGEGVSGALIEPDDGRRGGYEHGEMARMIGAAMGQRVFAPHLPRAVLGWAAQGDRMLRGAKAKLTPDRVGYMTHPDWVCRPENAAPARVWQPRIPAPEGLRQTAEWYRQNGWL